MLAIQPSSSSQNSTKGPNILPARITHSGPIPISNTHWNPQSKDNQQHHHQEVHFRGRKLLGRSVKVPEGYQGVVLQKTEKMMPRHKGVEGEDEEEPVEVKIMEQTGQFDEIVVWGHEAIPDEADAYRKGIEEWMGFAEAMHSYDMPAESKT